MNILCVCTGNTCRSPMLTTLLRGLISQRGLDGIRVESAGTGASEGEPATPLAVSTIAGFGLDLRSHRSRHIGGIDIAKVERVLCMTSSHAAYVRSLGVPANRIEVVNAEQGGVPDPFGGTAADYELCARTLERFAIAYVKTLTPTSPAVTDMPTPDLIDGARAALDAVHATEPAPPTGKPSELVYAGHIEQWIARLIEQPSLALRLAARAQHLERWVIPRSSFPMDKPGYLTWRKTVHKRQGDRAKEILSNAGMDAVTSERVGVLVAKAAPKGDLEAQALEDAACLTFLATELGDFASHHPDYTREKFIDIIRKTWRKMSPRGHQLALTIPLSDGLKELVKAAVAG
jgi:tRNAThr (cytosine32-N3)-methyltransferase